MGRPKGFIGWRHKNAEKKKAAMKKDGNCSTRVSKGAVKN